MGKFYKNDGCSKDVIEKIETELGRHFPLSYKSFLNQSNGGEYIEKYPNNKYILLFCCEDIVQYNKDYCVQKYLSKDIVAFASGDNGFFFDYRKQGEPKIVSCSFGDLDVSELKLEAIAFEEFVKGWLCS